MKIESFIFIHNQDILLKLLEINKFKNLINYKIVFLGSSDVSKIKHLNNLIIAREYDINIEEYPKLTSFTGWYCLWKNNLINSDYVNLFEYDINIKDSFIKTITKKLKNTSIIGYKSLNVHHDLYIKNVDFSKELVEAIDSVYNLNTREIINNLPKHELCTVTSNHTFSAKIFDEYMKWVEPLLPYIKNLYYSGHQIERSISLFYILNKIKNVKLIEDVVYHYQLDSHKTQGFDDKIIESKYNEFTSND